MEDFSSGYWKTTLVAQEIDGEHAIIDYGLYEIISNRLYKNTDTPPKMRVGLGRSVTFSPEPEGAVPRKTVGVPPEYLSEEGIRKSADERTVFLLKPEYAHKLSLPDPSIDTTDLPDVRGEDSDG